MAVMQILWGDEMWPVSQRPDKEKKVKVQVPGDKLNNERMGVKVVERMYAPS
jgi:hypothetical protein